MNMEHVINTLMFYWIYAIWWFNTTVSAYIPPDIQPVAFLGIGLVLSGLVLTFLVHNTGTKGRKKVKPNPEDLRFVGPKLEKNMNTIWKVGEEEVRDRVSSALDDVLDELRGDGQLSIERQNEIVEIFNNLGVDVLPVLPQSEKEPDADQEPEPKPEPAPIIPKTEPVKTKPAAVEIKQQAAAKTMAELWARVEKPADWDDKAKWSNNRKKSFFHQHNGGIKPEDWHSGHNKAPVVTPLKPEQKNTVVHVPQMAQPKVEEKKGAFQTVREKFIPKAVEKPEPTVERPAPAPAPVKGKLSDGSDNPFAELAA